VNVVWFKRDLRSSDHAPLTDAADDGRLLPLYVVEPELWQQPDMSGRQWRFARESLVDLDRQLAALGQGLVVRIGDVVDILDALHRANPITALWSHEETGNDWSYRRDRRVRAWCRQEGIHWHEYAQTGVLRPHPRRQGWAGRWARRMSAPLVHPPSGLKPVRGIDSADLPRIRDLGLGDDSCPGRQQGGRRQALDTLESFLVERYEPYPRAMSSPSTASVHCSRLSPHLAFGTVSLREVHQATQLQRRRLAAIDGAEQRRRSLDAFGSRLRWHCHFMQKLEDEPSIEFRNLHPAYAGLRSSSDEAGRLSAWQRGETGIPFVDACMRSLVATGWINFRMRAMLMSFASYQLWLDWRQPGEHLARLFTDYEPGIHWPQVQMQSGTTGINAMRIYNPVKQGYDHDPDGSFVRRWVPELAVVPDTFIHEPWRWSRAGSVLGRRYPAPIVDHLDAAHKAAVRIRSVRRDAAHRAAAREIVDRHGSRRRPPPRRGSARDARQGSFSFQGDSES
jgi:deoxyribodipyrimidine photo-lyase